MVDATIYRMRTGCRWADLPACYPLPRSVQEVEYEWKNDGTLDRILATLRTGEVHPAENQLPRYDFLPINDLSAEQWELIEPSIRPSHWRNRTKDVVDAILYRIRTKCQWNQLPKRFPLVKTVQRLTREWGQDGTTDRILEALRTGDPQPYVATQ